MPRKHEIADGFLAMNEEAWLICVTGLNSYDVRRCQLISQRYFGQSYEAAIFKVEFKYMKSTYSEIGIAKEKLKELCFKDKDKAELKRVELIMCGE